MIVSQANRPQRPRSSADCGGEQTRVKRFEIESSVEAIRESGEIPRRILLEVERMVTTGQTGLEIAEYGVDPLEFGHVLRLTSGDHRRPVRTIRGNHSAGAGQAIGQDSASGCKFGLGPLRDRLEGEAGHRRELGAQGMSVIAERNCGDEGTLFSEPRPTLPPLRSPPT